MPSNPELSEIVTTLLASFRGEAAELMDMLRVVHAKLGYIPPSTVAIIADKAQVSRPQVYRAIELAPSLSLVPPGKHVLYICNAENCCMQGGVELMAYARNKLGIREFETTPDGKIRLESFRCFGNCSMSPNVMMDGRIHGLMDNRQLERLIEELREEKNPG